MTLIIQRLLDWVAYTLAQIIGALPLDSGDWAELTAGLTAGLSWLSSTLGKFSPLVPWDQVHSMLGVWVGLITVALSVQLFRLALWTVGR